VALNDWSDTAQMDIECLELMKQAKKLGLTVEAIKRFLEQKSHSFEAGGKVCERKSPILQGSG